MAHNVLMGDDPQQVESSDRHKPSRIVRVKESLACLLEQLARGRATSMTQEANRAIRELLEREGLWPPVAEDDV